MRYVRKLEAIGTRLYGEVAALRIKNARLRSELATAKKIARQNKDHYRDAVATIDRVEAALVNLRPDLADIIREALKGETP